MNYFTMQDADSFSFVRVPKELLVNPKYKNISAESKLLYGVLLDRVSLSRKNNWVDEMGRIFIIYTRVEIMEIMGAGEKKITKLFNELKDKELVEEKRQGLQKPNLIYVGKFIKSVDFIDTNELITMTDNCDYLQNRQNDGSGHVKMTVLDPSKRRVSNTNINNTNISNTENLISQSNSSDLTERQTDGWSEYESVNRYFENQVFAETKEGQSDRSDRQLVDDIKFNVLDMYFAPETMIAGDKKCQALIRAALMRLEPIHIDNIIYKFQNISNPITNAKAYIQTMLYNESLETNLYMHNQTKADMANWKD